MSTLRAITRASAQLCRHHNLWARYNAGVSRRYPGLSFRPASSRHNIIHSRSLSVSSRRYSTSASDPEPENDRDFLRKLEHRTKAVETFIEQYKGVQDTFEFKELQEKFDYVEEQLKLGILKHDFLGFLPQEDLENLPEAVQNLEERIQIVLAWNPAPEEIDEVEGVVGETPRETKAAQSTKLEEKEEPLLKDDIENVETNPEVIPIGGSEVQTVTDSVDELRRSVMNGTDHILTALEKFNTQSRENIVQDRDSGMQNTKEVPVIAVNQADVEGLTKQVLQMRTDIDDYITSQVNAAAAAREAANASKETAYAESASSIQTLQDSIETSLEGVETRISKRLKQVEGRLNVIEGSIEELEYAGKQETRVDPITMQHIIDGAVDEVIKNERGELERMESRLNGRISLLQGLATEAASIKQEDIFRMFDDSHKAAMKRTEENLNHIDDRIDTLYHYVEGELFPMLTDGLVLRPDEKIQMKREIKEAVEEASMNIERSNRAGDQIQQEYADKVLESIEEGINNLIETKLADKLARRIGDEIDRKMKERMKELNFVERFGAFEKAVDRRLQYSTSRNAEEIERILREKFGRLEDRMMAAEKAMKKVAGYY